MTRIEKFREACLNAVRERATLRDRLAIAVKALREIADDADHWREDGSWAAIQARAALRELGVADA